MPVVYVTSEIPVKVKAVEAVAVPSGYTVKGLSVASGVADQPIGEAAGLEGALGRIAALRKACPEAEVVVSVENFVSRCCSADLCEDIAVVVIDDSRTPGRRVVRNSEPTPFPAHFLEQALELTPPDYSQRGTGAKITCGKLIAKKHPTVNPADWHTMFGTKSRKELIEETLRNAWDAFVNS
eukprot:RCo012229